jgi:MFS transporter, DHA2 family, multidrug resistance protein
VDSGVAVTHCVEPIFQRDALEKSAALPSSDACPERIEPRRTSTSTAAIAAVLAAMVLAVLDAAIANVALPSIAHALQVTPSASVWVITAYQTALVMGLLPCAALGESLGHRRVFAGGVALFTAASVWCALSPSLPWLVAARFLQGLGAAAVMALGMALLRLVVPQRQLGAAIGWNALAVALASAAGPTLGALILSGMSWPWLFALNLPLGVLVLMASRALPNRKGTARRLDWFSVALNASAFALLVMGAEMLVGRPMLAAALFASGAAALVFLVRRELPKQAPLIPLDLLRVASFRVSVIASICCFAGVTISLLALPFYLQHSLGQTTLMTGLCMTPWPLTVAVAAPLAGRLADRVPTAWLCALGGVCLALGLAAVSLMSFLPLGSLWSLHGNLLPLVLMTMLCGLGFGLFQVPNNRNMLLAAPADRSGAAGGMQATARLVGQTAGGVVMGLLFSVMPVDAAPILGLQIAAVLTLAAGVVSSLRIKPVA